MKENQQQVRILRSYSKVWRIERMFYQLGGYNLPFPLAINAIIYFAGFMVLSVAMSKFAFFKWIPSLWRYALIPGALAYAFNNKLLDSKNPLSFLRSVLTHFFVIIFKGSRIMRFRNVKVKNQRAVFNTKISFRIISKV